MLSRQWMHTNLVVPKFFLGFDVNDFQLCVGEDLSDRGVWDAFVDGAADQAFSHAQGLNDLRKRDGDQDILMTWAEREI